MMNSEDEDNPDPVQDLNSKRKAAQPKSCSKKSKQNQGTAHESGAKTFQQLWLKDPQFKGWLEAVPSDNTKAKCYCCNAVLSCGKSDLQKHAKTEKHVNNVKRIKGYRPIDLAFQLASSSPDEAAAKAKQSHENKVKACELRLAAYVAEHNVAFNTSNDLIKTIKAGISDSTIVKDLSMSRTKCSLVVSKILAKTETDELSEELRKSLFSVLVDESTDVSNTKNMCILVR